LRASIFVSLWPRGTIFPADDIQAPAPSIRKPGRPTFPGTAIAESPDPWARSVQMKMYGKFAAMILTSTAIMLPVMYLNTYTLDHVFFSETRTYMALVMGATMAIIMLAYMRGMLSEPRLNAAIVAGSAVVFALALWLVRSQSTVDDIDYMKAMIPHHSIAILTSERARLSDARVQALAKQIIESQQREISEMKALIRELESAPRQ
jgi:hypothetical protein